MPSAVFAYVMATGVLSAGMQLSGQPVISLVLWMVAGVAWVVLAVLLIARVVLAPAQLGAALGDPQQAFGFFTVVAGTAVLGVRFAIAGLYGWAIALWLIALALGIVLGYAVPWLVVLRDHGLGRSTATDDPPQPGRDLSADVGGVWFVWVVAAQSLALLAAIIQPHTHGWVRDLLAVAAVVAWATGLGLYAVVGAALVVRVLRYGIPVNELGPSFWVVMGALALSSLAAAHIDAMTGAAAADALHGAAGVIALLLWSFASWLVPGLLLMGIWRHIRRRVSVRYTTELWAMIFPMAVYSVAGMTIGAQDDAPVVDGVGRIFIWVALAAWALVMVDYAVTGVLARRRAAPSGSASGSAPEAGTPTAQG